MSEKNNSFKDAFQTMIDSITPEILGNLKSAVETGRWPNGDRLTPEQVEHSMQVIIAYEARYFSEEHRTGFIDKTGLKKSECDTPDSSLSRDSLIATTKPHLKPHLH